MILLKFSSLVRNTVGNDVNVHFFWRKVGNERKETSEECAIAPYASHSLHATPSITSS